MRVRMATWNINSIRARIGLLTDWLQRREPDVVCLQETKVVDKLFPIGPIEEIGYHAAFAGQPSYNGVAILSREPLADVRVEFPLLEMADVRLISGIVHGMRVYCAYFPNGRDPLSPHYPIKLRWIEALRELMFAGAPPDVPPATPIALLGDYNVAPDPEDVYDPVAMEGHIHFHPDERAMLKTLLQRGMVDAFRVAHPEGGHYSWWDYRQGAFRRNLGLRIDHVFTTPDLATYVVDAYVDKDERGKDAPSDHAPVIVELDLPTQG
jgi:exodeoxyribonuclease III